MMAGPEGERRSFNTLGGFLRGEEPDEPMEFAYSATLRIRGIDLPLTEITDRLGVQPTLMRRKGELMKPESALSKVRSAEDLWHYGSPLSEEEPLERHIEAVWRVVKPHVEYVKGLKERYKVDVFCGYRSNCDHAGIQVPHTSLEMFTALEIPFGVSIIIA